MRKTPGLLIAALLAGPLHAAPPLTQTQRAMLVDGTTDGVAPLEQPGLYALLRNASAWEAGDERGAAVPDYDALYADPAAHRGEAVLIEGQLERTGTRRVERVGPWGATLVEWVMRISDDPVDVAVVLMPGQADEGKAGEGQAGETHPAASIERGRDVRLPARFYMVWRAANVGSAGGEGRFLVFVGPAPEVEAAHGGESGSWARPLLIFALVLVTLIIVAMLRKAMTPRSRPPWHRRPQGEDPAAPAVAPDDADPPGAADLPDDPAEAMGVLAEDADERPLS